MNKTNRYFIYLAGLLFIFSYSLIPITTSFILLKTDMDKLWLQAILFISAGLGAFIIAKIRKQNIPYQMPWLLLTVVAVAGIFAASYFQVIFGVGPATADWFDKALTPIFITVIGVIFFRSTPKKLEWLGIVICIFSYIYFLLPSFNVVLEEKTFWISTVILPIIGAVGSAASVIGMGKLNQLGLGRFYAMSARYLPIGILVFVSAVLYGNSSQVGLNSVLMATFTGGLLINLVLFLALYLLEKRGPIFLSVFLLMVPIATTILESFLHLSPWPKTASFFIGAGLIIVASIMIEFAPYLVAVTNKNKSPA